MCAASSEVADLENRMRQSLEAFGIKLGARARCSSFAERVRAAVGPRCLPRGD